jgi:hypothetical protein
MAKVFKSPKEAEEVSKEMVKWAVKTMSMSRSIPFVHPLIKLPFLIQAFTHHDGKTAPWWPSADIHRIVVFLGTFLYPWRRRR